MPFAPALPAVVRRRRQPGQAPQLAAVLEPPPGEQLVDQQPGTVLADSLEVQQLTYLLDLRALALADRLGPLLLQLLDLPADQPPPLEFPEQTIAEARRHG